MNSPIVPFSTPLGTAAVSDARVFWGLGVSRLQGFEDRGDWLGDGMHNITQAARAATVMGADAACAKAGLSAVMSLGAATTADNAAVTPELAGEAIMADCSGHGKTPPLGKDSQSHLNQPDGAAVALTGDAPKNFRCRFWHHSIPV